MKISFIIPVLNGERYIKQCLDHIAEEMDSEDEIIVVDNGSTDSTLDIVREYEGVRILIYPEITIAALRNRGAEQAGGPLLAFIDSDCILCKGWRNAVEEAFSEEEVHSAGSSYMVRENPTWIEAAWCQQVKRKVSKFYFVPSGNFVIRRNVFHDIGGFNENLQTDEDTEICRRLNDQDYSIFNDPEICVVHLGNAQTIREFIGKERWHASAVAGPVSFKTLDKPLLMTYLFILFFVFTIISFFMIAVWGWIFPIIGIVLFLSIPIITALYKSYSVRRFSYVPGLIILFLVFYFVRSEVIIKSIFKKSN
ncbi:MAG: glycosyltransferase [Aliifodinibius sp.]|nr:glycosyltransferase [candidate division Zixibacteria bacterium]NIT59111.1 glycosyltransferase [Fodinibius sp.]NIX57757.1 glycosyltransferase [candidate division Zixibacteria bacterium]NIY27694.1 glycosyltransferase [Fodinibius sp.]